jgi:hypothetical protein
MSVILDIDLDYFNYFTDPLERLGKLLSWAGRPVDAIVEKHHEALRLWSEAVRKGEIDAPHWILHVDEHHDMMGERPPTSFGNFLFFAMRRWPKCRVRWLAESRIDSPRMWLSEHAWKSVGPRFAYRVCLCRTWPRPDMVTVSTSPGFLDEVLRRQLLEHIRRAAVFARKAIQEAIPRMGHPVFAEGRNDNEARLS